jgi:hypothetical protein
LSNERSILRAIAVAPCYRFEEATSFVEELVASRAGYVGFLRDGWLSSNTTLYRKAKCADGSRVLDNPFLNIAQNPRYGNSICPVPPETYFQLILLDSLALPIGMYPITKRHGDGIGRPTVAYRLDTRLDERMHKSLCLGQMLWWRVILGRRARNNVEKVRIVWIPLLI